FSPADQFDAWQRSFSSILELSNFGRSSAGYEGRQVLWDLGPLAFAHIRSDPVGYVSIGATKHTHSIDHWMISVVRNGVMRSASPRGMFPSAPGCIQIHSLVQRFSGHACKCDMLVLFVPRDFCPTLAGALEAQEFSLIGSAMGSLLADYLDTLS